MSPTEAAPGVATALERPRPYQPLTFTAVPNRGASRSSASRPRLSTGPRPLCSPGQPQSLGCPLQGRDRNSAVPPSAAVVSLFSECKTARLSASRHQFKVGPSGADQLSVRHARLRGHAPLLRHL
ncbi:hypothetical protein NDU88_002235 [Pleurodeles waltl]|uniref:Uncharacterized protein n=1 Tax=Pleurodeles waltl TaxID=8319 RepID=A0AAV7UX17_PLEWA|nr:hypothetical protein NDU88_002235 [Pleurodeles waltl]